MKRILLSAGILLAVGAFLLVTVGAKNSGSSSPTYKIQLDNAFGLVNGADFKVAGVKAGTIKKIDLDPRCIKGNTTQCYALVTIQVTQQGFGQFHSDAFCQSRPQSLIGEYFIECEPGHSGPVLKNGSVIPVTHTQSTIPADLLNDIMRLPYRERFSLIINELGAAAAGRSQDLQAALRRAVPALTETDNLLNLLANDSHTLQQLTVNSDAVITALANNSGLVQNFIEQANKAAVHTANQQQAFQQSLHDLPGFLAQLKPAMAKLGQAATTNEPVLANLHAASGELNTFFHLLVPFSRSSLPALRSLGKASVTGKVALQAARPTISDLNRFAKPTPELAQNLAIVLRDLDNRSRAVEADSRSPTGRGYTGLEALLQYVFNQTLAINQFSTFGHELTVDAFIDQRCAPYATPQSVAKGLQQYGPAYRQCYAWLGPNQPGINETDPSNPSACVPDPGGAPPGYRGPRTTACKLSPSGAGGSSAGGSKAHAASDTSAGAPAGAGGTRSSSLAATAAQRVTQTLSAVLSAALGLASRTTSSATKTVASKVSSVRSGSSGGSGGSSSGGDTQQLLNYLLAP